MNEALRRKHAVSSAAKAGMDALLVDHPADVRYLSGFTGSNGALALMDRRAVLFTDGRYTTQAREEAAGLRIVIAKGSATVAAALFVLKAGATRCGFNSAHTTVAALTRLQKALATAGKQLGTPPSRGFLKAADDFVARLREIKDTDEIARTRRAADAGCRLFEGTLEHLRAGVPENEVAAQLELAARRLGAEGMSFETIVAGGERSALPHGRASTAKLPRRGFCTLDFGVLLDGYCSDMTRTVHLGRATPRARAVYHSVLTAQQDAIDAVRPGVTAGAVDKAARDVLRRDGLAKFFTHSTGHGVGLEIHEGPRLAAKQEQKLEPGMVITIEPGVYLPGEFGVRIEDMVLVTENGHEVLTAGSSKQLLEL